MKSNFMLQAQESDTVLFIMMNFQEQSIHNKLPKELRDISSVSLDYSKTLNIIQDQLKSIFGDRADWKKCLKNYFCSIENNGLCYKVNRFEDIPELTRDDIDNMLKEESIDDANIKELLSMTQINYGDNDKPISEDMIYRAANILGLIPESENGFNRWIVDFNNLTHDENDAVKDTIKKNLPVLWLAIRSLADFYSDGFIASFSNIGTAITQMKRRFYYRGENAFFASSNASIYRIKDKSIPKYYSNMIRMLRLNEGGLFLEQFDAVLRWPILGGINYLALLQHYGMYTPVMDVTNDLKTALFFACCKYENKKWRPLRKTEFQEKDSREKIYKRGGDSRYAILYRSSTEITDIRWVTDSKQGRGIITPIGYQPFMRCSAQHGYSYNVFNYDSYDMMQDILFEKYKIRLTEDLANWIYSEMDNGQKVYPNNDIIKVIDLSDYLEKINTTKIFSKYSFDLTMQSFRISGKNVEKVKNELRKYGICIVDGNSMMIDEIYFLVCAGFYNRQICMHDLH